MVVKTRFTALMLAALCLVAPVAAADTALRQAAELWLDGDDARALPMLADLAADGNVDARLLLGRIETSDLGLSPFRRALEPNQSRALFRQKGWTVFGKSWIAVEAAQGNALAQALIQSKRPDPDPDLIARLIAMGEVEAADYPTRIIALYGDDDMRANLLASDTLLQDLKPYLNYLSLEPEPRGDLLDSHISSDPISELD